MIPIKKKVILGSVAGIFIITAIILVVIVFRDSAPDKVGSSDLAAYLSESENVVNPDTMPSSENSDSDDKASDFSASVSSKVSGNSVTSSPDGKPSKNPPAASSPSKSGSTTAPAAKTDDTTKYKRTGEMKFSDSPDNAFIKAIAKKYGSDAALLVAIYTVPQADGNTVLEFDGTKDSSGKLIRNGDTLKYIYTLDASYNAKRASKKSSENDGYTSFESSMMFYSVNKYLIPEYENEL